jgi:ketosteroid isomerase-like protein
MSDREAVVRRMWEAYEREGLPGILKFAAPDARWRPYSAAGREFDTTEAYRRYMAGMDVRDEIVDATLVGVELVGEDEVVVEGRLRVRRGGSVSDSPMFWRHRFRGEQIIFTASAPRRAELFD